jgi:hypothetical protein
MIRAPLDGRFVMVGAPLAQEREIRFAWERRPSHGYDLDKTRGRENGATRFHGHRFFSAPTGPACRYRVRPASPSTPGSAFRRRAHRSASFQLAFKDQGTDSVCTPLSSLATKKVARHAQHVISSQRRRDPHSGDAHTGARASSSHSRTRGQILSAPPFHPLLQRRLQATPGTLYVHGGAG